MQNVKFPVVIVDGPDVITFTTAENGTFQNGTPCASSLADMMIRVESGKAQIVINTSEIVITKDETKTTNYGGMWATDGVYDYSYDRCNSSISRWEKGYVKASASISHKKLKWHNLDQDGLKSIIRTYDLILKAANEWGDIRAFTY